MDPRTRDRVVTEFRHRLHHEIGFTWFEHQAEWQLASEGWSLLPHAPADGDTYTEILVGDPLDLTFAADERPQHTVKIPRAIRPRLGVGKVAHQLANMASYKGGKSYGGAAWLGGFAVLPKGDVQIVGLEYSTSEPEFGYLCEMLCSEPPRGMNMKYTRMVNDVRAGKMILELKSGCSFKVKSWNQKEGLKGKKVDAYYWAEAYQLPGLQTFNSVSQNLRQNRGFSAWTTTPDEPWVTALHDKGHGEDPDWHCTCGARDDCNPFTFDQAARDRDDPDKGGIMTRERFEIAHNGRLGSFVGRVYNYGRGEKQLLPHMFPMIFHDHLLPRELRG